MTPFDGFRIQLALEWHEPKKLEKILVLKLLVLLFEHFPLFIFFSGVYGG